MRQTSTKRFINPRVPGRYHFSEQELLSWAGIALLSRKSHTNVTPETVGFKQEPEAFVAGEKIRELVRRASLPGQPVGRRAKRRMGGVYVELCAGSPRGRRVCPGGVSLAVPPVCHEGWRPSRPGDALVIALNPFRHAAYWDCSPVVATKHLGLDQVSVHRTRQ